MGWNFDLSSEKVLLQLTEVNSTQCDNTRDEMTELTTNEKK
jgi:hypothetical protein